MVPMVTLSLSPRTIRPRGGCVGFWSFEHYPATPHHPKASIMIDFLSTNYQLSKYGNLCILYMSCDSTVGECLVILWCTVIPEMPCVCDLLRPNFPTRTNKQLLLITATLSWFYRRTVFSANAFMNSIRSWSSVTPSASCLNIHNTSNHKKQDALCDFFC